MRHEFKPDGTERQRKGETKRAGGGGAARAYWCAACTTRVAGEDAAIEVGGAHRHRFVNPAGLEYEIACFRQASCLADGEPTLEFTWFPGFEWSFASCRNCQEHLGWCFVSDGARFFGLILARLLGPI